MASINSARLPNRNVSFATNSMEHRSIAHVLAFISLSIPCSTTLRTHRLRIVFSKVSAFCSHHAIHHHSLPILLSQIRGSQLHKTLLSLQSPSHRLSPACSEIITDAAESFVFPGCYFLFLIQCTEYSLFLVIPCPGREISEQGSLASAISS